MENLDLNKPWTWNSKNKLNIFLTKAWQLLTWHACCAEFGGYSWAYLDVGNVWSGQSEPSASAQEDTRAEVPWCGSLGTDTGDLITWRYLERIFRDINIGFYGFYVGSFLCLWSWNCLERDLMSTGTHRI